MTNESRLPAIRAAMALTRAAVLDDDEPVDVHPDLYGETLVELARFCAAETAIAALWFNSTALAELAEFEQRAAEMFGTPAAIVPLRGGAA